MKIDSKEILNINFSTKLKEAENNLYSNLITTDKTVINIYLQNRLNQKRIKAYRIEMEMNSLI